MAAAHERPVARTPREEVAVSTERGAVTVEAALAIGSLAVVLALAIGALAVMLSQLRCQDAAGIAARLAARGEQGRAEVAVRRVAPVGASLTLRVQGDEIEALVEAAPLGGLVPAVTVTARAYAVAEPGVPTGQQVVPSATPRPGQASAPDTAAPPMSTPPVASYGTSSGRAFPASSRAGSGQAALRPPRPGNSPGAGLRGRRGADRCGFPGRRLGTRPRGERLVPPHAARRVTGAVGVPATHRLRAGPETAGERSPPGAARRAAPRNGRPRNASRGGEPALFGLSPGSDAHRSEGGFATILSTVLLAVLVIALTLGVALGVVSLTRQRAVTAAELAALAAAARALEGDPNACERAELVARRMDTVLISCEPGTADYRVEVRAEPPGFAFMGAVHARARSGVLVTG